MEPTFSASRRGVNERTNGTGTPNGTAAILRSCAGWGSRGEKGTRMMVLANVASVLNGFPGAPLARRLTRIRVQPSAALARLGGSGAKAISDGTSPSHHVSGMDGAPENRDGARRGTRIPTPRGGRT